MTCVRLIIPGDPRPKGRPRLGNGWTYTPPETRRAENAVKMHAKLGGVHPLHGPVSVELRFYRSNRRRCDLDNLSKLVLDALNGIAYRDDAQIEHLDARKDYDPENPRTEITIEPFPPPEACNWVDAHPEAVK